MVHKSLCLSHCNAYSRFIIKSHILLLSNQNGVDFFLSTPVYSGVRITDCYGRLSRHFQFFFWWLFIDVTCVESIMVLVAELRTLSFLPCRLLWSFGSLWKHYCHFWHSPVDKWWLCGEFVILKLRGMCMSLVSEQGMHCFNSIEWPKD